MEIKLLNKNNLNEIIQLYNEIKNKTYTLWDNDYPSEELVLWDIERKGLYGVFENQELIAVTFLGERNEEGEENFTWKQHFNKRGTFARIGVSPNFQNRGIGTLLVKFVLEELKKREFDGVRILVGKNNKNAIKLYKKFGFYNSGETSRYGHDYYLFELRLIEKESAK